MNQNPLPQCFEQLIAATAPREPKPSGPRLADYVVPTPGSAGDHFGPPVTIGTPAPTPVLPRYVTETWDEACARVPALLGVRLRVDGPNIAGLCNLADSLPGYELLQILPLGPYRFDFLFRRVDPARAPVSLATF